MVFSSFFLVIYFQYFGNFKKFCPEAVNSPYYRTTLDVAAVTDPSITAPSTYEVGTKYLEIGYEEKKAWVATYRHIWEERRG